MRQGPFIVVGIKRIRLPYLASVLIIGGFLVLLGQLLFWLNGVKDLEVLVRHWYIPMYVAAFAWVECVLCWAHDRYEKILRGLSEAFDIPKEEYTAIVDSHLRSVYGDKWQICAVVPLFAVIVGYVLASRQHFLWIQQHVLSELLAYPSMVVYFLFIAGLGSIVGGYGIAEIIYHIRFVRRISRLPLNAKILRVRRTTALKELAQFSGASSITWFVGLAMISPVFVALVNVVTFSLFVFALVVGIAMLVIPQLSIHGAVVSAKLKVIEELTQSILSTKDDDLPRILSISTLFRNAEEINEWPFGPGSIAKQIVGLAIPIFTYILQLSLRIP